MAEKKSIAAAKRGKNLKNPKYHASSIT